MEKYLGNKRVLLNDILTFTNENCPDAKSVYDVFTGTTNVARMYKHNGFDVYANDSNRFSYVLGKTYLNLNQYPNFSGLNIEKITTPEIDLKERFKSDVAKDKDTLFSSQKVNNVLEKLNHAEHVFNHLNSLTEKVKGVNYFIYDHYTTFGKRSSYKSVRGTKGKRNYFSKENSIILDNILHRTRDWFKSGTISEEEMFYIMTAVIEEATLNANVSGTFHDFNRNKLWPNSLQRFFLKLPVVDINQSKGVIFNADSEELSTSIPAHDVLYIDPPYNFRQYSAYYHLLNFIAIYPLLDDVKDYLSEITFVRGQRMDDDFTSKFCFKAQFMDALDNLIRNTNSRYIIMSYYGGRNHWNHWSQTEEPTDEGFSILSEYFNSSLFCSHNTTSVTKLRQNYQSRAGEKKSIIDEYLFFAEKLCCEATSSQKDKQPNTSKAIDCNTSNAF